MIINNILINTETRAIKKQDYDFLGVAGENEIEQLVFRLTAFIDGIGIIEIQKNDEKYFIELNKEEESYVLDIKNSLLSDAAELSMQLHITTDNSEIFKSKIFTMKIYEEIHATESIPEEYPEWIDTANAKIQEIINLERTIEQAELERANAERARATAEENRNTAENTRAENETSRNSAEESRASAELTRKKNESDRITNENGRIEAENNRRNAETSRNTAEQQRQTNEEARQTAEQSREEFIANLRQSIENGDYNGATFTPHLDKNGDLSWTNNKNLDNPATINIMGPRGPQGETGPKPVAGTDYYTKSEKETFAAEVIEESKTEIEELTTEKLNELSAVNTLKIISEEVIDL